MKHLVRIASVSPRVHLGNVTKNCEELETVYRTYAEQVDVIVTPELSLTGYTCGDLFVNRHLIDRAEEGLLQLAEMTAEYGKKGAALVVGEQVYLDSFLKIAKLEAEDAPLTEVLQELEKLSERFGLSFIISVSRNEEDLPEAVKGMIETSL